MNPGKQFEEDIKKSVPKDVYYLRLHDSAIGFDVENSTQRFALKSPYDVILCKEGRMYCLELKSNSGKSMSFEGTSARIKPRQVQELLKAEEAKAKAGLILNFRNYNKTIFVLASEFQRFMDTCGKKSISMDEAEKIGVTIPSRKLKVHYRYDLEAVLG